MRAEPEAEEEVRREQGDVETGGAIDFHEVALPKILDPRGAEGKHSRPGFLVCFRKAQGSVLVNGDCRLLRGGGD